MRIAHFFSGHPSSGAALGTLNLCQGLIDEGVDLQVYNDKYDFRIEKNRLIFDKNILKSLKSLKNNIFDRNHYFGYKKKIKFSSGLIGNDIHNFNKLNKFDIIHLHWINSGFINIRSLEKIKIPIVWTIRDMWPFTGGCHYTLGCEKFKIECHNCPNLKSYFPGLDQVKKIFEHKSKILQKKKIYYVAISKWLEFEIKKSFILKNQNVRQIYNCVDNFSFFPEDMTVSREKLGLPKNKFIILIGSQFLKDEIKDNSKILEIINKFDDNFLFITFGNTNQAYKNFKNFGFINDKTILRKIYSASNLFLSFAKQEAFGKTLAESVLCNTPVVVNDNLSSKEIISHKSNGYLVKDDDYIKGINWIKDNLNKNEKNLNLNTENNFSINEISKKYLELYKTILLNKSP